MSDLSQGAPAPPVIPSVLQSMLMLVAIAVVCGAYLALNAAVGSKEAYVGFLFLFYWTGLQKADLRALPASAAGAFVGLGFGFLMRHLQLQLGVAGTLVFLALVLLLVFLFLQQRLRVLVNDATMLTLTVATIAHVQSQASFRGLFLSLAIAVVFFGSLFWGMARLSGRGAPPGAAGA